MKNTEIFQTACIVSNNDSHILWKSLKRYKAILMLLIMSIAVSLVACGRNTETPPETNPPSLTNGTGPRPENGTTTEDDTSVYGAESISNAHQIDRTQFYGETLTIYAVSRYSNNISAIADEYMRLNPGITIEIISFGGNLTRAIQETSIALGDIAAHVQAPHVTPPVLIESALVSPHDVHHFVNWTPFIDSTPNFNDNNFFMNVIDAMTVDSYLYEFPLAFSFSMVAANHTIPGLTQSMEAYEDGITMYRLLGLMNIFNTTGYHHEMLSQPMFFLHNFDIGHGFNYLQDSFDLETGVANFNNQRFIDFLNSAHDATYPDKVFGADYAPSLSDMMSPDWAFVIWRYFFYYIRVKDNHVIRTLGANDPIDPSNFFSGATPIVSDQGNLIITPATAYVLNSVATPTQQALAWDFMQFMASEEGTKAAYRSISSAELGFGMTPARMPMIPINREAARFSARVNWPAADFFCIKAFMLTGTTDSSEAFPRIYNWLDAIGDMPMVLAQTWPDAVRLTLQDFHNGMISAADAAVLIQDLTEFESVRTEE